MNFKKLNVNLYPATISWQQYENGKDYKRKIGLYETVNENERFYRGDQWNGVVSNGLPTPIFNVIKRIITYLINSVMTQQVSIIYTDENIPFKPKSVNLQNLSNGVDILTQNAAFRWEQSKMNSLLKFALLDSAISGDAVFYTYWDPDIKTGQAYKGDFVTVLIDNVNLFVADVNVADIQSQEYIIISGRTSISTLKKEAALYGVSDADIDGIIPDNNISEQSGDMAEYENQDVTSLKATYLIKFWRDNNGFIIWEKSVKNTVIHHVETNLRLYPIAYFSWDKMKNSFHGVSPITGLIQNQKYVNKAYAMLMKHMVDTAFSKVIYDKKLIPEWSNEVGQAIGVISGGDISNVATTIGVGKMQSEFLDVIQMTINNTKELMGATDVALGEVEPNNTSAIMALQESSSIPIDGIRDNLHQCVEDIANIWVDMMCEYYTDGRLIAYKNQDNIVETATFDYSKLRDELICAKVDIGITNRYSQIASINILDKLLQGNHITFEQYLERIPNNIIPNKNKLLEQQ